MKVVPWYLVSSQGHWGRDAESTDFSMIINHNHLLHYTAVHLPGDLHPLAGFNKGKYFVKVFLKNIVYPIKIIFIASVWLFINSNYSKIL